MNVTWDEYKEIIGRNIRAGKNYIYRGQSDSLWGLTTSIHRADYIDSHSAFISYFESHLPKVRMKIEAWDNSSRDLDNPQELAEFLALLQHNGFPTPLLDWSDSPYIAAYFAFEGVSLSRPDSDELTIYSFDKDAWIDTYHQSYSWKSKNAFITMLRPNHKGNHKQMLQQGLFWFTNCPDPESHIKDHENTQSGPYLTKYIISVKERQIAMHDLAFMGITAVQLAPSLESVCKNAFESILVTPRVEQTASEKERIKNDNLKHGG